ALVPARERIADRALDDGRPDDRARHRAIGQDDLLSGRLCVRVRVGPAAVLRALHAELGQDIVHPDLALARHRDLEVVLVVGVAPLLAERRRRALAELRDVLAIVGPLARLIDHLLAVGDLGRRIEVAVEQLGLAVPAPPAARGRRVRLAAREVADDRLVLPDIAVALTGDVAGRDVAQPS